MKNKNNTQLDYIPFVFPGVSNVRCAFQTKRTQFPEEKCASAYAGGNISLEVGDVEEHVLRNRHAICSDLQVDAFAETKQVHGTVTIFEPAPANAEQSPAEEADGMATERSNLALMVKSADCQPVLLTHVSGKYIAGLHAGWRGNRSDFVGIAIKEFCKFYHVDAKDLMAVRGPSLGPACAEFVNFDTEWGADFAKWYNERTQRMDLWTLARTQLKKAGLLERNIFSIDLCTYSLPELFYSFRKEPQSGRLGSFIWRTE